MKSKKPIIEREPQRSAVVGHKLPGNNMRDRLLILYGFLIVTIITGVTLFAASGSVYLLKGDESGEQFVEVADLYILNSLAEDTIADGTTEVPQELSQSGKIYYDDTFLSESKELKTLKSKSASESLLDELKRKDRRWHAREHTVKSGDSVWKLAKEYETDYTLIVGQNSLTNPDQIVPGKKLTILTKLGISYKVRGGDTLSEIALNYRIPQKSIRESNSIGKHLRAGSTIFLPDAREIEAVQAAEAAPVVEAMQNVAANGNVEEPKEDMPAAAHDEAAGEAAPSPREEKEEPKVAVQKTKRFMWPAEGRITSGFGMRVNPISGEDMFHNGIDISMIEGTAVKAAASGKIIFAGWKDGYGNMVVIRHKDGYLTVYAHLLEAKVRENQNVSKNQVIALSGNTGLTTGAHLHFEIRKYDTPLNPSRML